MHLQEALYNYYYYLEAMGRSIQTIALYKRLLKSFAMFVQTTINKDPYLSEITLEHLEAYFHMLTVTRKHQPITKSHHLYTIRSFFKYAYKKEWITKNMTLLLEPIRVPLKERHYLEKEEVETLSETVKVPLIRSVIIFLYYTGLRISEALSLKMEDVDCAHNLIYVLHGKGDKERIIPISGSLKLSIDYYVKYVRKGDSLFFFCTKRTGTLSVSYTDAIIRLAAKKLGFVKSVSCHILRHSFAYRLIQQNVGLVEVQKLLGHSNLAITSIYTHTNMERLRMAVEHL